MEPRKTCVHPLPPRPATIRWSLQALETMADNERALWKWRPRFGEATADDLRRVADTERRRVSAATRSPDTRSP